MRIGFIVNPIAGLGGAVGLKGTDGRAVLEQAQALGAQPMAPDRARRCLDVVAASAPGVSILAAGGGMGAQIAAQAGLSCEAIALRDRESAAETTRIAGEMASAGVDLIVFAGGDGTARDVLAAVGLSVPVLGVPCGVKMHSGVFAVTPEAAGRLIADLATGGSARTGYRKVEIMDIDEQALRQGRVSARLYGYARSPHLRHLLQNAKSTPPLSGEGMLAALGEEIAGEFDAETFYLVGPGTTAKKPLEALGLEGALLGVDILRAGRLVASDVSGDSANDIIGENSAHIVIGVTGGQGFVFGRGNQQISPAMIRRTWPRDVTIMASPDKLAMLGHNRLQVDTGDPDLDRMIGGYVRVRTAPGRSTLMRIA